MKLLSLCRGLVGSFCLAAASLLDLAPGILVSQALAGACPPVSSIVAYDANLRARNYSTLQSAVTAGKTGWEIVVGPGSYATGVVTVSNKTNLRIKGCSQPQIAGFKLQQSSGITITGFAINAAGTGNHGITLRGGEKHNRQVTMAENFIHDAGSSFSGISVARGNEHITILGNHITGNGRDGVVFADATGGPHLMRNNTIDANGWNGVEVARQHDIVLEANVITGNGTAVGSVGGRYGVLRERVTCSSEAVGIKLINNTISCNNGREVAGRSTKELGNYDQMLDATDSGNILAARCGVLDTTPPAITVAAPAEGLATNQTVAPVYSVTDDLDPNPAVTVTPPPPYSTDGAYQMIITAVDNSGNQSQTTRNFTIDKTPPRITVTAPVDNATVLVPTVDVRGTVDDPVAVVTVNGLPAPLIGSAFSLPRLALAVGQNTVLVEAHDALGNKSTLALSVTLMADLFSATFSASAELIIPGESTSLSWTTNGVSSLSIDQGIGRVASDGSQAVSPEATTTYTLTAVGSGGALQRQVTVTVSGAVSALPAGTFGKQYEDLVPRDATLTAYDPERFSIVTGQVAAADGALLPGVSVFVLNHPEYGRALTDDAGRYSLPVDGGGVLTLIYEKDGHISTQRQVDVGWNVIALVDVVALLTEDPRSTTVTLDGNPDSVFTHRSTQVADAAGSRAATIVLTGDNQVYAVSGNQELPLSTFTMRATEFQTEASMPAKLPPTSGFTYCVELSVDGAVGVRFAKPVTLYVDNFLGFDVGEIVPVGFYDRDRGAWIPSDNGVVVRLLDGDSDGVADGLDADGDGLPDDLDGDGSADDDCEGLSDASRYPPAATFWRIRTSHFTPVDANWPTGPPQGAVGPANLPEPVSDADDPAHRDPCALQNVASTVDPQSRVVHEDIVVPGTDLLLHYASDRVPGYKSKITVPSSGATIHESLRSITAEVTIGGRRFVASAAPEPLQRFDFAWDGLDYLGLPMEGVVNAAVKVSHTYDAVYYRAPEGGRAFAEPGVSATSVAARGNWTVSKSSIVPLYRPDAQGDIAAGWTLSAHHRMDASSLSVLFKGDGTTLQSTGGVITTYSQPDPGEGTSLQKMAIDSAGSLYVADPGNRCVWKVDKGRNATIVAGVGLGCSGNLGDGGPATAACLEGPADVAVDAEGSLYIADRRTHRVRKVDRAGIITTVVGNGANTFGWGTFSGDGGPARDAGLDGPTAVDTDRFGNLYIADRWNRRIRKVDSRGIISTVAGDGQDSPGRGDGGPATAASLWDPTDVVAASDGSFFLTDAARVRKVGVDGLITTIAGQDWEGNSGDGGLAREASLGTEGGLAVDGWGGIYIADRRNGRVRKITGDGVIYTVAGGGSAWGDFVPALESSIYDPTGVVLDPSGDLYISGFVTIYKLSQPEAGKGYVNGENILFPDQGGVGYVFSTDRRHLATVDLATGRSLQTFGYDQAGEVVSIADRFGNAVTLLRDGLGTSYAIISPDGIQTTLTVNGSDQLEAVLYPDGSSQRFAYGSGSLMTDEVDPNGNVFVHQYDADGRLSDVFDPAGGHWNYERTTDAGAMVTAVTQSSEADMTSATTTKDLQGNVTIQKTGSDGTVSTSMYANGGMSQVDNLACGTTRSTIFGYDSKYGFRVERNVTERVPSGFARTTARRREYQDSDWDGVTDQIVDTVAVNGAVSTSSDNIVSGSRAITTPLGRQMTLAYDPATLLPRESSMPGFFPTSYSYDSRGRLHSATTGARTVQLAYDPNGRLDFLITPDNKTFDYTYDVMGRLSSEVRPDGSALSYQYDANGNMTVLANPNQISLGFGYSTVNQRKNFVQPLSGSYQYSYDRDRRLITVTAPSGEQITNIYSAGQLATTTTPEGVTSYDYPCGGRLGSATRNGESVAFGYDGPLVTSDTRSGTLAQTIGYSFNNNYAPVAMNYAGTTVGLAYDIDGLLSLAGGFTISRNAQNGLPEGVSGLGLAQVRTFNGYGELDGLTASVAAAQAYSWSVPVRDAAGRILRRQETIEGNTTVWEYAYDAVGRLMTVKKEDQIVESYSYDDNGNRLTETNTQLGIAGRSYGYTIEDHVLTAGSDSYQFDVDGFLHSKTTADGTSLFQYSSRGELLRVDNPDGTIFSYVHDPSGRRIAKQVNGTTIEKYLWAGQTTLLAVYDGNDNLLQRFTYVDARMPVSMTMGAATYFLLTDQVGTLRAVADSSGSIVKRVDYDSFGNIVADTNPAFTVPFGFAGGLHDRDTGLVRFGARDYDPAIGRFTAKDPIDFAGGDTNLYAYVMSDPVNFIDPLGLYDRLVHYSLTLQLALKAGFSSDDAYRIAAADQGIDDDSDTGPYDKDGGPEYHFSPHSVAQSKMSNACTVDDLGKALHRLQDSYSHAGYTWASGGHIRDGVKPDIYNPSSARDIAMRSETLKFLMSFRKLHGGM